MSLVFAAITPHPPLLIPTIGGEDELKKVKKTLSSFTQLEEEIYSAMPDIILVISPHGSFFSEAFTINFCTEYFTDLKKFGDLSTKLKFKGDYEFAHKIRNATKTTDTPAVMISEPNLDHGTSIPLYFLTKHLPEIKIIQIGFSDIDYKKHVKFGSFIKEQIQLSSKRIAVIASADLSHALTDDSPAGFNKLGLEFDNSLRELLSNNNFSKIINFDKKIIEGASECGLRSILILIGILSNTHFHYKELSYEYPFGVGYLTSQFII